MTFKPASSDSEFKGNKEILCWILDVLARASRVRKEFYRHHVQLAEEFARNTMNDDEPGKITENTELYCAAHASLIFSTIQTIESFHGALTASNYLSRNRSNFQEVRSILLDPRNHKGGVMSTLQKKSLSSKMKCNLTSIPRLDTFAEPTRSELNRMFTQCFERFELCTKYSYLYWNILKPVRDVYAHNYRFVFLDESVPEIIPQFDETLLGFLSKDLNERVQEDISQNDEIRVPDILRDLVFVGFIQRLASSKLVSHLTMFEGWIYHNMRMRIWNNDTPVLPERVPYMAQESVERYAEIRESQNYDFTVPKRSQYGRYEKKEQEELHKGFLKGLQDLGESIAMTDQKGKIRKLRFLEGEDPSLRKH